MLLRTLPGTFAVFKCICQTGFKMSLRNCHFWVEQVEFFGRTLSPDGPQAQDRNFQNFFKRKVRFTESKKGYLTLPGICEPLEEPLSQDG